MSTSRAPPGRAAHEVPELVREVIDAAQIVPQHAWAVQKHGRVIDRP
jgi:hypothetical protein